MDDEYKGEYRGTNMYRHHITGYYYAYHATAGRLMADTLSGLKQLIRDAGNHN